MNGAILLCVGVLLIVADIFSIIAIVRIHDLIMKRKKQTDRIMNLLESYLKKEMNQEQSQTPSERDSHTEPSRYYGNPYFKAH